MLGVRAGLGDPTCVPELVQFDFFHRAKGERIWAFLVCPDIERKRKSEA